MKARLGPIAAIAAGPTTAPTVCPLVFTLSCTASTRASTRLSVLRCSRVRAETMIREAPIPAIVSMTKAGPEASEEGHRQPEQPQDGRPGQDHGRQAAAVGQPSLRGPADRQPDPVGPREQPGRGVAQPQDLRVERDRQGLIGAVDEEGASQQRQQGQCAPVAPQGDEPLHGCAELAGLVGLVSPIRPAGIASRAHRRGDPQPGWSTARPPARRRHRRAAPPTDPRRR